MEERKTEKLRSTGEGETEEDWEIRKCGIETRRRPIGRDYTAAKDAESEIIRG
jgi:hypothetical protein